MAPFHVSLQVIPCICEKASAFSQSPDWLTGVVEGKLFNQPRDSGMLHMESTTSGQPRPGQFFILEAGKINGPTNGVVFENLDRLLSPPRLILLPEGGGFPPLRETPRLVYNPSKGPPL